MNWQILAKNLMQNLRNEMSVEAEKWLDRNYSAVVHYGEQNPDSSVADNLSMLRCRIISRSEAALNFAREFTCGFHEDILEFRQAREDFEAVEAKIFMEWIKNSAEEISLLAEISEEVDDTLGILENELEIAENKSEKIPMGTQIYIGMEIFNSLSRFSNDMMIDSMPKHSLN